MGRKNPQFWGILLFVNCLILLLERKIARLDPKKAKKGGLLPFFTQQIDIHLEVIDF